MMKITTHNTVYRLEMLDDGTVMISGNAVYCPNPVRSTIVKPGVIGDTMIFRPLEGLYQGETIVTSAVEVVDPTCSR